MMPTALSTRQAPERFGQHLKGTHHLLGGSGIGSDPECLPAMPAGQIPIVPRMTIRRVGIVVEIVVQATPTALLADRTLREAKGGQDAADNAHVQTWCQLVIPTAANIWATDTRKVLDLRQPYLRLPAL